MLRDTPWPQTLGLHGTTGGNKQSNQARTTTARNLCHTHKSRIQQVLPVWHLSTSSWLMCLNTAISNMNSNRKSHKIGKSRKGQRSTWITELTIRPGQSTNNNLCPRRRKHIQPNTVHCSDRSLSRDLSLRQRDTDTLWTNPAGVN